MFCSNGVFSVMKQHERVLSSTSKNKKSQSPKRNFDKDQLTGACLPKSIISSSRNLMDSEVKRKVKIVREHRTKGMFEGLSSNQSHLKLALNVKPSMTAELSVEDSNDDHLILCTNRTIDNDGQQ